MFGTLNPKLNQTKTLLKQLAVALSRWAFGMSFKALSHTATWQNHHRPSGGGATESLFRFPIWLRLVDELVFLRTTLLTLRKNMQRRSRNPPVCTVSREATLNPKPSDRNEKTANQGRAKGEQNTRRTTRQQRLIQSTLPPTPRHPKA